MFAARLSSSLTISDFPLTLVSIGLFKGGEMKISFTGFLRLMNSLKSIRKLPPLNSVAEFGGSQDMTLGGFTSFGPPSGLIGCAQP